MLTPAAAKTFLKTVPHHPGVYQMLNRAQEILYVGKAKDLRKRLASYFRYDSQHPRTQSLLAQVTSITTIITTDESAALLLEYSLIKSLKPRYNIVFKDDRSYPYLLLSNTPYPALSIYRGTPKENGFYFGPFPHGGHIVHETLLLLQKTFKLRQCSNAMFKRRSRPCLQYQIGRCTAPCVNYVTENEYAEQVNFAKMFLTGKSNAVTSNITHLMRKAAENLEFERAAYYREQLVRLKNIQKQHAIIQPDGNIDVVALAVNPEQFCIDLLVVRHGMTLGNKLFYHSSPAFITAQEILATFLVQYYSQQNTLDLPQQLLLSIKLTATEKKALETAINSALVSNARKISLLYQTKTKSHKQWLQLANTNAKHKLQQKLATDDDFAARFAELERVLVCDHAQSMRHLECFDVSHHGGESTVVSCVAFNRNGAEKKSYRRYNIQNITAGDDYAALQQALERHFAHYIKQQTEIKSPSQNPPEILIIDGGKGQLKTASEVLHKLNINNIALLAVAKGKERKVGAETIYFAHDGRIEIITLPEPLFMLVLHIRDEAHRFAIEAQRANMRRRIITSPLEDIPGIGKERRNALLRHFGGWQEIKAASVEELSKVQGISSKLAQSVYSVLRLPSKQP